MLLSESKCCRKNLGWFTTSSLIFDFYMWFFDDVNMWWWSGTYGGWFGTLLCVVLSLATARQSAKRRAVGLSSRRLVASDARRTARCRAACCRDVTLSLGSNWRIGYLCILWWLICMVWSIGSRLYDEYLKVLTNKQTTF
jgi:hypothetical protein